MASLLGAQTEEHRRRDKKLRLYLMVMAIPLGVLLLAFLWVLLATLPKLR